MSGSRCTFIITALGVIAILACVFADPNLDTTVKIDKASDGLSTASDTVAKESQSVFIDGLNGEQLAALREKADRQEFQAEVNRMMKLIINSLYKNKEIFIRELISNASDALDKIRIESLTNREALAANPELSIRIKINKDTRTLHIIDSGIGMSAEDLTANLGTIAKSGTAEFLDRLASSNQTGETDLIGQFGVGFYSSFLVSSKVMVISKKNDHDQFIWESDSKSFTLVKDPRGDTLKRGTELVLFLNEEAEDYLQPETLKRIVKKYSQFINFQIYMWESKTKTVEVEPSTETTEKKKEDDSDVSVEEEKKEEPKTQQETVWYWALINEQKPIWKRKPADVTEEEYKELYQALSKDQDEPLAKVHFRAEGDVTFTCILYIPKRSTRDIFSSNYEYRDRIKLYVHRVFISDAAEELLPKYLGFLIGIVDSDDLPLNVSREMLQQNQLVKVIRKKLIRKAIEMLSKLSEEDYEKFWKEYSVHIKLGMADDHTHRNRLSKLLRYRTSKSGDKFTSLTEYVSRMKTDQNAIYYLTGVSFNDVKSSPFVERLDIKGYEVIHMIDPLDEYLVQSFTEFDSKPLQNVAKEGVKIDASEAAKAKMDANKKEYEELLKWLKEDALKDKIERAELSEKLLDTPCALVAGKYGWSGNMERIMRAQAYQRGDDSSAEYYSKQTKTLEINPRHPIIKELKNRVKVDSSDEEAKETVQLLFYTAILRSGYAIQDSVDFANKIEVVMRKNLAVDANEPVEAEPEEAEEIPKGDVEANDEETNEENTKEESKPEPIPLSDTTTDKVEPETEPKDEL